jgi:hypothetical protein
MRLWKLTPRHGTLWSCAEGKDPWHPAGGRAFGLVVRAADAEEARWLAHAAAGDENGAIDGVRPWLDDDYSECAEVRADGPAEVLLVAYRL